MNAGLGQAVEISQVLLLKRSILVMGWERYCRCVYLSMIISFCLLTVFIVCVSKCAKMFKFKTQLYIRYSDAVTL